MFGAAFGRGGMVVVLAPLVLRGGASDDMFERFTDRAQRVVVVAQEEARVLNHNYIGTEHILATGRGASTRRDQASRRTSRR